MNSGGILFFNDMKTNAETWGTSFNFNPTVDEQWYPL